MARQGKVFSDDQLQRIINLLAATEMTIAEIAERMHCSRSAIASINRKHRIREYAGFRSRWITLEQEIRSA